MRSKRLSREEAQQLARLRIFARYVVCGFACCVVYVVMAAYVDMELEPSELDLQP